MRKIFLAVNLLLVVILLTPAFSVGQQKKKDQKKDGVKKEDATLQDYTNLAQVKEITGKIADLDLEAGTLTFTFAWTHMEPNPNAAASSNKANQKAAQLQLQMLREYNTIMTTKNPIHQQEALMRFQQRLQQLQTTNAVNLLNMFRTVKSSKDFEISFVKKVKVARVKLEQKYNDEGEVIKYTPEELKKMKSVDVPGSYIATPEELKIGQSVTLYLIPPKKQDSKKSEKDAKKSDSATDAKDKVIIDSGAKQASDTKDKQASDAKDKQASDAKDKQASNAKDKQASDAKDIPPLNAALADRPQVRMVLILEEASPGEPQELPKTKKK